MASMKKNKIIYLALILVSLVILSVSKAKNIPQDYLLRGKTFVNYFDGVELNVISFGDSTFESNNGEMERMEYGRYSKLKSNLFLIKRTKILNLGVGGQEELDSTKFIIQCLNESTITFTKRISYNSFDKNWDTIKLDKYLYKLKVNASEKISPSSSQNKKQ